MSKKIVILGTGGTIAGHANSPEDNVGYRAGERSVQSLLDSLASGKPGASCSWVAEQVAQIDSKDAEFDLWLMLYERCVYHLADETVGAIVVTHGTDTLEETAWFLSKVLPAVKPVVITCAMRPVTALGSDGPRNLTDALALAGTPHARGVSVVCAGTVHAPRHLRKVHPYHADAFSSGESGPMGWIEEGALRLAGPWSTSDLTHPTSRFAPPPDVTGWPWVEIVQSHAGARPDGVEALVASGVQGLVVAATGNGTIHFRLESALNRAARQQIPIRVTSKCSFGAIVGVPNHGLALAEAGVSPEKARVSLILELLAAQNR